MRVFLIFADFSLFVHSLLSCARRPSSLNPGCAISAPGSITAAMSIFHLPGPGSDLSLSFSPDGDLSQSAHSSAHLGRYPVHLKLGLQCGRRADLNLDAHNSRCRPH